MRIRLNGAERETQAATISILLEELRLPPQMVLVEHNGHAPPRADWPGVQLRDGDAVEIMRIAAGG